MGAWRSPFRGSFFDMDPFRRAKAAFSGVPAVDVTETEKGYKVVAELPGMDEKNIGVKIANGQEEKEEEKQDYYLCERNFGSFERARWR
jgi:HSP20 family protein